MLPVNKKIKMILNRLIHREMQNKTAKDGGFRQIFHTYDFYYTKGDPWNSLKKAVTHLFLK